MKPLSNTQNASSIFENSPLNLEDLCVVLKATKSTLYQYNREGMPHFFVGKEGRYILSKVIDWLEKRSAQRVLPQETAFDPHRRNL